MKDWLIQSGVAILFFVWEYWLGKTKKVIAASTLEMVLGWLLRLIGKGEKMGEHVIVDGQVGDVLLSINEGKVKLQALAVVPGDMGASAGAVIECDGVKLLDKLFEAIKLKTPDSVDPIADGVKEVLKAALLSVK